MGEAESQASMLYHFRECEVGRLCVKIALDDMQVRRCLPEEVIGFSICDVA